MTKFAIERQYLLPVYQHLIVEADDIAEACRKAIAIEDWPAAETKEDSDSAGPTTIARVVEIPEGGCTTDENDATGWLYSAGLPAAKIPNLAETARDREIAELTAEMAELIAEPDDGPADTFADRRREIFNRLEELAAAPGGPPANLVFVATRTLRHARRSDHHWSFSDPRRGRKGDCRRHQGVR